MKKLAFLLAFAASSALANPLDLVIGQRNTLDNTTINRVIPTTLTDGLVYYNVSTNLPAYATLGSGLSIVSGVLTVSGSGGTQVNSDWNATTGVARILNKPTIATVGMTGQYLDLSGLPALFSGAYADLIGKPDLSVYALNVSLASYATVSSLSGYATTSALTSGLATKFNTPSGTTAQYLRGDGSAATFPSIPPAVTLTTTGTGAATYNAGTGALNVPTPASSTPFNFSQPTARTLAVSTSYQATDNTKAAIIVPSYACQNSTTVLAASACTVQVRMGTGTLTCSTGTVYYTQSLTVALGVLITQNSTNPVQINLPIGASFIVCPSSGTFTISAVEQTAG